jgi:hypothetical protein
MHAILDIVDPVHSLARSIADYYAATLARVRLFGMAFDLVECMSGHLDRHARCSSGVVESPKAADGEDCG